jgi:hypothetical protein
VSAHDAYLTAQTLAQHGLNSDQATHADMDAAADHTGAQRPDGPDDRHAIRTALDTINP